MAQLEIPIYKQHSPREEKEAEKEEEKEEEEEEEEGKKGSG